MIKRSCIIFFIVAVVIISVGCSDNDKGTCCFPPPPPGIVGTIDGIVRDAITNEALDGLHLFFWRGDEQPNSVKTSSDGSFIISELRSGDYFIHVIDPDGEYTMGYETATIVTIDQLKGDIDVNPSGEYYYRVSIDDDCNANLCLGPILLSK